MSKPSPAPEPTMEEILASIRRIISDGDEMAAAAPPPPPPPQRSAAPTPIRPAAAPVPQAEEPQEADVAGEDDADIFDLTDAMVAKSETVAPDFDFDSIDIGDEDVASADPEDSEPPAAVEPAAAQLVEPDVLEFGAEEEADYPEPPARPVQAEQAAETQPPRPSPEPAPRTAVQTAADRPAPAQEPAPAPAASGSPAQGGAEVQPSLLSPQADSAVAAAFGQLADNILTRDPKTLEDIVKEMLRPMLKDWLDDNLPVLVERLVREEIERVSRGRR